MTGIGHKALIIFCIILAIVGSLGIPRRDLRSLGQVAGIALDEENGRIRATFELYDTVLEQPIGRACYTATAVGDTIEECMENVYLTRGKAVFANDALVMILENDSEYLLEKVYEHYSLLKNDHMDIPVVFAYDQEAGKIFSGNGMSISMELAQSLKKLNKRQTIRDLMNGNGDAIYVKGEGAYEIIS